MGLQEIICEGVNWIHLVQVGSSGTSPDYRHFNPLNAEHEISRSEILSYSASNMLVT
jgi:hypothetical protein